jgi:dolichol-phosphate mannosyltransferase
VSKARPGEPLVSIVVPVLDEQDCVAELSRCVREAMAAEQVRYELVFVDDGSRDATPAAIAALQSEDPAIRVIRFTRRFGHQAALTAGLRHARGDVVITMDGDLQHPPEVLPHLLAAWAAGADVVHTARELPPGARRGFKERAGQRFYRLMNSVSRVPVLPSGADFRLLDRRVVEAFNALEEHFVFVRGLVPWLGFDEVVVEYQVGQRFAGRSKYRLAPMLRLALDGIFAFSVVPLRLITLLGLLTTLVGVSYGIYWLFGFVTGRITEAGWTSVVGLILMFGGVQLLSVGVLAEYVGRVYEEVKRRPRYVIDYVRGGDES